MKSNTLKHKLKHKKCNPYKNGPAEWKKVDYINEKKPVGKISENVFSSNNQYYYPDLSKNSDTYLSSSNSFNQGDNYYYNKSNIDSYDIDRARGIYLNHAQDAVEIQNYNNGNNNLGYYYK